MTCWGGRLRLLYLMVFDARPATSHGPIGAGPTTGQTFGLRRPGRAERPRRKPAFKSTLRGATATKLTVEAAGWHMSRTHSNTGTDTRTQNYAHTRTACLSTWRATFQQYRRQPLCSALVFGFPCFVFRCFLGCATGGEVDVEL